MTNIARGPRGDYSPGRGDLCGQKFINGADEKVKRDLALKRTRNALQDGPVVLVDVPGGGAYLVPREVHQAIVAQVEDAQAQAARL